LKTKIPEFITGRPARAGSHDLELFQHGVRCSSVSIVKVIRSWRELSQELTDEAIDQWAHRNDFVIRARV